MSQSVPENTPVFSILSEEQLHTLPNPEFLVEGVLAKNCFAILFAPPGSGKTFVAQSLAYAVALGRDWMERGTLQGPVLYVAGEGLYGLNPRSQGIRIHLDIEAPCPVYYLGDPVQLLKKPSVDAFLLAIKYSSVQFLLIVLDTFARCFVGGDENSARDVGMAIDTLDRIKDETGASILLIHHTNKGGRDERGSSALRGAADAMFGLKGSGKDKDADDRTRQLTADKLKDCEPFDDIPIYLESVALGNGRTTLVATLWSFELMKDRMQLSQKAHQCAQILARVFGEDGATHKNWKGKFLEETGASESTFNRLKKQAVQSGYAKKSGEGKGAIFLPSDRLLVSVSDGCHDGTKIPKKPADVDVTSPPSLGGDTDTNTDATNPQSPPSFSYKKILTIWPPTHVRTWPIILCGPTPFPQRISGITGAPRDENDTISKIPLNFRLPQNKMALRTVQSSFAPNSRCLIPTEQRVDTPSLIELSQTETLNETL